MSGSKVGPCLTGREHAIRRDHQKTKGRECNQVNECAVLGASEIEYGSRSHSKILEYHAHLKRGEKSSRIKDLGFSFRKPK